jgi:CRISPR-associated protein Cmr4
MSTSQDQVATACTKMYWIHALSPIHVGSGRGVGFIDLPIMREAVTHWPLIPGSAVKGVLADWHGADTDGRDPKKHTDQKQKKDAFMRSLAFGRSGNDASNAGSLVFTDSLIVCLPVRSLYGTFAWCTCPMVLERLRRDLRTSNLDQALSQIVIPDQQENSLLQVHLTSQPASKLAQQGRVYFEDLDFTAVPCDAANSWSEKLANWIFGTDDAWRARFQERFAVVHDDVFNFLCEHATQVDARVRIRDETKTVAEGQLWYEEALPTESILAGIAWCGPILGRDRRNNQESVEQQIGTVAQSDSQWQDDLLAQFCQNQDDLQIGGKATVGRGRVRLVFTDSTPTPSS